MVKRDSSDHSRAFGTFDEFLRCAVQLNGRLEHPAKKYPRNLESPRVSSSGFGKKRFQDDGNVSRCYSTGRPQVTTLNEFIVCQKKQSGAQHQTCLPSSLQLPVRQFQGADRVQTLRAHWLYARNRCVPLTATHLSPAINLDAITHYHQENTIERHRYGGAGWLAFGEELFLVPELTCMFRVSTRPHLSGCHSGTTCTFVPGAPWVLNFCLWMTMPALTVQTFRRMPSIGGYHPYGLASILTELKSIEHMWDMLGRQKLFAARQPPSHLSTGT
ncbi:transposable element Tcb1 transposase [Trichonephila clavipes]|nr:transposable element Tcb1 transposase [Trichonephila clavipes]